MAAFMSQQVDFSSVKMDGMNGDQLRPEQAKAAQPLDGAYAVLLQALLDLVACFVQMHMDWYFQLGRQGGDMLKGLVSDGVGCVWSQAESQQGITALGVADGESLRQIVIGIDGITGRETRWR
jgi:hypothetical protein